MSKKILILALSVIIIFVVAFYYFNNLNKTVDTDNTMIDEDTQLRNNVIEIETNIALTHIMKMPYDELVKNTELYIHPYYKETYFNELQKANETHNLVPYLNGLAYYRYISKVYTSDDDLVKQIFTKLPIDSAINSSTNMPVEGTKGQVAKLYIFKKESDQWKIFSVNNYYLSIDRNSPKRIIERFTNYNDSPIEYESIKVLE